MTNEPSTLAGEQGGGWTEEVHETLYPDNFNHGLARYISREINPSKVLEFGAGLGHLARYITDNSSITQYDCIEPNPIKGHYRADASPRLHAIDIFSSDNLKTLGEEYDLVVSIEVAEHVGRHLHKRLFDFLVSKSTKWIVFSGARVGQGGHGHIAERDEAEWKDEFLQRGCIFQPESTESIRSACDKKNINHRRNLMVFRTSQSP